MKATVMMVTYNRLDLTKKTLDNLIENTEMPFNLCIVDNGSTDETINWLETEFMSRVMFGAGELQDVHIKKNKENKGIAIGRNQALVLANKLKDPYLVTVDNDIWVPKGWLTKSIDVLKNNPKFGAIGVNMENVIYPIKNGFQEKPQGNLGTACMVFSRSLHDLIGFFNHEDYKYYAHEDADWGMRIRTVGLKLGYIEEMGKHLGEGEQDKGEYREFKDKWHANNLNKFFSNTREYMSKKRSHYIPFKDE